MPFSAEIAACRTVTVVAIVGSRFLQEWKANQELEANAVAMKLVRRHHAN